MAIRFPRLHIAESALNRIQNTLEGIGALGIATPTPIVPDPTAAGLGLDAQLQTPMPAAGAIPGNEQMTEDDAIGASLQGGSPGEAVIADNIAQ